MKLTGRLLILAGVTAGALAPAVTSVAPATAAGSAQGSIGIRLTEAPSNRADDPRAKLYIVDHLAPGTTIQRKVEVANDTDARRHIELYAAGADVAGGEFTFFSDRDGNEVSDWTKVAPPQLDLAPRTKGTATVTIAVPAQASAGERYAVVWAETASASAPGTVAVVNRVGVRIYLSVGAGGEPASDFTVSSLTARRDKDGRPVIDALVQNTGGRAVQLSGEVTLTNGPGGLSAGPIPARAGTTVGPGETATVTMVLGRDIPKGPWEVSVRLRSGRLERPATARISFPAAAGSSARPVAATSKAQRPKPETALTALGLLVLVAFALVLLWLRRRSEDETARRAGSQPVPARSS